MDSADVVDYSVFVGDIKNRLKRVEELFLKAEVGATTSEIRIVLLDISKIEDLVLELESLARLKLKEAKSL